MPIVTDVRMVVRMKSEFSSLKIRLWVAESGVDKARRARSRGERPSGLVQRVDMKTRRSIACATRRLILNCWERNVDSERKRQLTVHSYLKARVS